jgi:DNA repair exonuclease SbcCD ATPase subunit
VPQQTSQIIRQPVHTEPMTHNSQFLGSRGDYGQNTHSSYIHPSKSVHIEPKFTGGHVGSSGHDNPQLREMQSRIHREIDDKVKLELEKKELEVLLDNEYKRQEDITRYYDEEKRTIKDENWNLEQKLNTLERDLEQKTTSAKDLEQKVSQANSDNQNFQKENFNLKEELKRLGEMTNVKVRELDDKLSQNINIIENEKTQYKRFPFKKKIPKPYHREIEQKKMQNADKVKRMEEEYNRRLSEWQIKLQKANETSIKYDSEINFLKEKMHSLDAEARSKLESIKQRVQEEEQRKSMSILRGFENKLKATEEEKRQHERRSEQLSKEMDRLGILFQNNW